MMYSLCRPMEHSGLSFALATVSTAGIGMALRLRPALRRVMAGSFLKGRNATNSGGTARQGTRLMERPGVLGLASG
jgi:hypothetical protein